VNAPGTGTVAVEESDDAVRESVEEIGSKARLLPAGAGPRRSNC